jgi:hypothetical protein
MRVSVRVVSGTSIETNQPDIAMLSISENSELGNMELKGIDFDKALITVSDEILLKDSKGNEINLDISTQTRSIKENFKSINFKGLSKEKMISGSYKGKLITTIQYM